MQGVQWRQEREVGSGAFGKVTAWTNQVTNERLVIKQVHSQNKLDAKSHADWLKEIALMNTMSHDNIVSGRKVPDEIKKIMNNPEDLLGLEICDCDLRKVLTQPSNCCGLKEKNVLNILRDVSRGMKFLHEDMKITHRDLKPENILLKHRGNETVYKITDLGYAKRIDANSICMSFVGTLQYLAPELYEHTSGYTYTADYWSFGTVIFECITGERPFLLTDKPFEWFKYITSKRDEQIWGYFDENVGTKLCTELPVPNQLCGTLLSAFKDWLQLVLRQDRHKRGKNIITGAPECFVRADNILHLKVIHVFDMLSCEEVAYESQRGQLGSDLKLFLEQKLSIPKDDQLLIFAASGEVLEDDHPLVNDDLFKDTIYLFSKNKSAKHSVSMIIPERVCEIMAAPEELHSHAWLKKAYTHCVFYCRSSVYKYKCLLRGLRALMINMKSRKRLMLCLKEDLNTQTVKLETVIELYVTSCNADINYMKQSGNLNCEAYENEWDPMLKDVQSFLKPDKNKEEMNSLQEKFSALQESVVGFQQSDTELDRLADEAERLYVTFRASDLHKKYNAKSSGISGIVKGCRSRSEGLFKLSSEQTSCVMKSYDDIGSFNTSMEKQISNLKKKYKLVMEYHISRQRSLLRKLSLNDSPMPSLQSDLLVGLECAFKKAEHGDSCTNFSPGVITCMCDNFNKLKKLTKDELASTETVAGATTTPNIAPITTYCGNNRPWLPLNLSSMSRTQPGSGYIGPRRTSSSSMHLSSLSSEERSPSQSSSTSHFRFNERRDKCDTLCLTQDGQTARHLINISPSTQLPEHHVSSPRPVGNMHDTSYSQMMMMMHPCNDAPSLTSNYDSWRTHPSQQFNLINCRHATPQAGNISFNNSPRPSQGRYIGHASRASEYVCGNRHPFGGSPYEPSPSGPTSYNLRMQQFSNAPLSLNHGNHGYSVNTSQYNQRHPMSNNPQVYHRGYFVPVFEDMDMISL